MEPLVWLFKERKVVLIQPYCRGREAHRIDPLSPSLPRSFALGLGYAFENRRSLGLNLHDPMRGH